MATRTHTQQLVIQSVSQPTKKTEQEFLICIKVNYVLMRIQSTIKLFDEPVNSFSLSASLPSLSLSFVSFVREKERTCENRKRNCRIYFNFVRSLLLQLFMPEAEAGKYFEWKSLIFFDE